MSHIYADGAEVLKALDEQGGGPKLASLGDYGVDHYALLDQLRILERPVINRQELREKSIEKIAMERHAVVFEQLVEERIKILQKVSLFNDLSDNELRRAAEQFEEDERDEGTFVFKQGEASDDFYVVASGEAHVIFESDGKSRTLSILTEGRYFGELAAMHSTPRDSSVRAKPDKEDQQRLELLKLSGVKFRALFESRPDLLKDNSNTRERQAWCIIGNCPLFAGLDEDRLRECVRRVKVETHDPGSVIIHEGHTGSVFYIIVDGIVKVVHEDPQHKVGERPVRELGDGDHFGEIPLLVKGDSSTRGATVVAVFKCTLAVVERSDLVAAFKTDEGRAYLRQRAYFRILDDDGELEAEEVQRPRTAEDRASRRSGDSRAMRGRKSARAAFKRLVRSFSDSLISQMYKQIVRQPSLTTSYGADVAKSFMASATRPEFGKKILRALETLNKKNALDRTMPELALVIAVLRQAKDFCRQYVHEWPESAWNDFGHHVRVDRVKKGSAVFDTKGKAVRFYILVRGTAAVLAQSTQEEVKPTRRRSRARSSADMVDPEAAKDAIWKGELGEFVECGGPGSCFGAESLDALKNGRAPRYRQNLVAVSECIFLSFEACSRIIVLTLAILRFSSLSLAVLLACCIDICILCDKNALQDVSNSFFNSLGDFFLNSITSISSSYLSGNELDREW